MPDLAIYVWHDGTRVDVRVQDESEPPPHPSATRLKTRLRTRAEAEEFARGVLMMAQEMGVESIQMLKHL